MFANQLALTLVAACIATGCSPSRLAVRPLRYDVEIDLDPQTSTVTGKTRLQVQRLEPGESRKKKEVIELKLHPDLILEEVEVVGATLQKTRERRGSGTDPANPAPTTHRLVVSEPEEEILVVLQYGGRLSQDVAAGEKEGEIHNFGVSAHVGEEGIFLAERGYWYPVVELPDDADPELSLAGYRLSTAPIDGFELVAGLERRIADDDGRLHWASPFPLDGMVLLGGPWQRWSRRHGEVELHAVLHPDKQAVAADILDASAEYLDRYQSLIGDYPFSEFTVLEAFFSSGFAFPTCTQIVGSQLSEYKQYRRHGYLDHELLHNWWGNGIFVDPDDGNWCEALASHVGNYHGHLLDGDEKAARKQRRNQSNFLSAIEPEDDKPLGTFGQTDGAGRGVGYMKGAAVFGMLERKVGADAFFAGLRRLTAERMGGFADWAVIREALEAESETDLGPFFEQWVRGSGAPLLELKAAEWTPGATEMALTISQGETEFDLDVPLRLHYGERAVDVVATVDERVARVTVEVEPEGLTAVELDPDYYLFRKLEPEEVMPTSALTRRAASLLIVLPDGELSDPYQRVVDGYERAVLGDDDDPNEGHEVTLRRASAMLGEELIARDVLVVGDAVRAPIVREFLERTRSPVVWRDDAFEVEGDEYAGPGQAVFFTVHHPDLADGGVTVYYGNSEAALANARVLSYYPNSLLVFETPLTEGTGETPEGQMPRSEVIRRIDFEFHDRIDF